MKITSLQYAKALFAATEHAPEHEVQAVVARFSDRLRRDGRLRDLRHITEKFSQLWNASRGIVEADVTSRTALAPGDLPMIERFIADRYQTKEVIIRNTVDATIGGGIIIRVGDELFDGSVATQLASLRKQLGDH